MFDLSMGGDTTSGWRLDKGGNCACQGRGLQGRQDCRRDLRPLQNLDRKGLEHDFAGVDAQNYPGILDDGDKAYVSRSREQKGPRIHGLQVYLGSYCAFEPKVDCYQVVDIGMELNSRYEHLQYASNRHSRITNVDRLGRRKEKSSCISDKRGDGIIGSLFCDCRHRCKTCMSCHVPIPLFLSLFTRRAHGLAMFCVTLVTACFS